MLWDARMMFFQRDWKSNDISGVWARNVLPNPKKERPMLSVMWGSCLLIRIVFVIIRIFRRRIRKPLYHYLYYWPTFAIDCSCHRIRYKAMEASITDSGCVEEIDTKWNFCEIVASFLSTGTLDSILNFNKNEWDTPRVYLLIILPQYTVMYENNCMPRTIKVSNSEELLNSIQKNDRHLHIKSIALHTALHSWERFPVFRTHLWAESPTNCRNR